MALLFPDKIKTGYDISMMFVKQKSKDFDDTKWVSAEDVAAAVAELREKIKERKLYLLKIKPNDTNHQLCIAATISELILQEELVDDVFGGVTENEKVEAKK